MAKKSFFDKLITSVAKSADKAIRDADKQREQERKASINAEKKQKASVQKSAHYGNIPAAKTRKEADDINKSFRQSDNERWSQMDFVVGIEIRQSNNPKLNRECCKLLAGKYPKSFNWHGWFEGCACHSISVLATEDELLKSLNKDTKIKSKNEVVDYPDNFKTMAGFKKTDKLTKKQAEQAYKKIYELYNTKK